MISIDEDPANDGWIHSMRKVSKNEDIEKGGVGSGIKGHKTYSEPFIKPDYYYELPEKIAKILLKYEYMDRMNDHQVERFRREITNRINKSIVAYEKLVQHYEHRKTTGKFVLSEKENDEQITKHKRVVKELKGVKDGLIGAFSQGEKKIAIDAAIAQTHTSGEGAMFRDLLTDIDEEEAVNKAMDYIRDQRIHKFAKGILGEGSFLDLINSLLGLLTHHKLEKEVISASHDGLRLGINTAKLDIGVDELEPDRESLARIGLRARALSDRTMSKARGDLAFNAEKLYQELDAAIESGMAEREALGKIRPRVGKLFTDALKPHELERLVRDQFLVATKEGRRSGWAQGDVKWRQWAIHSDSKTGEDSKRMKGQITGINEPYTDPKTGDKYMIEHIRPNDRCLFSYQTPIYTSKGWKAVGKIEVGELVLTHKGRFRKVIETFKKLRKDGIYVVHVSCESDTEQTTWKETLSMTYDHPLLTNRGWVLAKDLVEGDEVRILANQCKKCGKLIPFNRNYCSRSCISKMIAERQWKSLEHKKSVSEKAKAHWAIWNKENPELRKEAVKNSHKVLAEKAIAGEHPFQRPETRRRLASVLGDKNSTNIEIKMEKELTKRKFDFGKQENIGKFFADFSIPEHKIAIECDGEYWHQDKEAEAERDRILEGFGWTVLHFTGHEITTNVEECVDEIERVLQNHTGEYCFMDGNITKIIQIEQKISKMTYNIEVEEDHSFIAKGIVNHNCYGIPLFELPETTERGGLLYAKSTKNDFEKGGVGSGIKGHTTAKHKIPKKKDTGIDEIKELRTEKGLFKSTADAPAWDNIFREPKYHKENKRLTAKLEYMSPIDYLKESIRGYDVTLKEHITDMKKYRSTDYAKMFMKGDLFPIPWFEYYEDGTKDQEGNHRAMALQLLIEKGLLSKNYKMPVIKVTHLAKEIDKSTNDEAKYLDFGKEFKGTPNIDRFLFGV